jgi:hypothetical protein
MKKSFLLLAFLSVSIFTFDVSHVYSQQPTQVWARHYGGIQPSFGANGYSVKFDSLGYVYVLVGLASDSTKGDYGLLKYSNSGNLIWSQTYNSPGNLSDGPVAFDVTGAGDVYITGNYGINFIHHITTVKLNSNGVLQWAKVYNGGGPDDGPTDIAIDRAGNIIVTGGIAVNNNSAYALIIKYNPNGDSLWVRKFTQISQQNSSNLKLTLDDSDNIYTAGYCYVTHNPSDYLIIKYNSIGTVQWYTIYDGTPHLYDIADFIRLDSNKNIYVVGSVSSTSDGFYNTLLKLNPQGTVQWARSFAGIQGSIPGCEFPAGLELGQDNNSIYYTTFCENGTGGGGYDIATLKYNSSGDSVWVRRFGGGVPATDNKPTSLKIDKFDNIYVTGEVYYPSTGYVGIEIKYLPNGTQNWLINNNMFLANEILFDTGSSFYLAGSGPDSNNVSSAEIVKYNQPIGIVNNSNQLPMAFRLNQNYPNPFNSSTIISYELPKRSGVQLKIYNSVGQLVKTLVNTEQEASYYTILLNTDDFASGVYFYQLQAGTYRESRKMLLIK